MKDNEETGVSVWRGGYTTISKLIHTDLEASVTVQGSEGDMLDKKARHPVPHHAQKSGVSDIK